MSTDNNNINSPQVHTEMDRQRYRILADDKPNHRTVVELAKSLVPFVGVQQQHTLGGYSFAYIHLDDWLRAIERLVPEDQPRANKIRLLLANFGAQGSAVDIVTELTALVKGDWELFKRLMTDDFRGSSNEFNQFIKFITQGRRKGDSINTCQ